MGCAGRILLVFGLAALLLGGAKSWFGGDGRTWVASRDLPRNHRLDRFDLARPTGVMAWRLPPREELEGRYLLPAKRRGDRIAPEDVAEEPDLVPPAGSVVLFYRLEKGRPETSTPLAAGSRVRVCSATARIDNPSAAKRHCVPQPLSVLAVHPAADGESGWLALAVPDAASEPAAAVIAAADRFLQLEAPASPPSAGEAVVTVPVR